MRTVIILLAMLLCLFGPTVVFALVGYNALKNLGKRPSRGAEVMIPALFKIVAAAFIILGVLMALLKVFAPSDAKAESAEFNVQQTTRSFPPEKKQKVFNLKDLVWMERAEFEDKLLKKRSGEIQFHLFDLRNEGEFAGGALEGAVNMPYAKMSFLAERMAAKEDVIVLYGRPGHDRVTANAAIFLVNKGYRNVSVLKDGYFKS